MDLFDQARENILSAEAPLAARMRPRVLEEFIGQRHVLGPGRLLRRAIQADRLSSLIFYGPPGTGKTTLARIIANTTRAEFCALNAVLSGVADIRAAVAEASKRLGEQSRRTILFIDEVHRFNKSQQDALLPHVENGTVILIGATTENPYFEVNKPLVSRSRIFELRTLEAADLEAVMNAALEDSERGYGARQVRIAPEALTHLANVANGDARAALNALELAVETTEAATDGAISINLEIAEESIQRKAVLYDKEGDAHFDAISAFIKSMRGSDPDAALYWMARMVYAGEDPRFIFRRMIIFAAEDVGLADPNALRLTISAAQAYDYVGLPEGRFHLAEACLYLSTAPKSNSGFAFFEALATVEKERVEEVPDHLKDASRDAEGLGHGEGYLYPHAFRDHWVAQQYLPEGLRGRVFYEPSGMGFESELQGRVQRTREAALAASRERAAALLGDWPGTDRQNSDRQNADRQDYGSQVSGRKKGHGAEEWSARGRDTLGEWLGKVRERMFTLAEVGRHHLVLDAHAGTGLLTWEATRLAREGGVWALARQQEDARSIRDQAALMPSLTAPEVIEAPLEDLPRAIGEAAGGSVLFDRIMARDSLHHGPNPAGDVVSQLKVLAGLLAPGGRLVLAERAPRLGERILAGLDWKGLPEALATRAVQAETALYDQSTDPRMTWRESELKSWCEQAGLEVTVLEVLRHPVQQVIPPALVERWFGSAGGGGGEPGAPGPLAEALGQEATALRSYLERTLSGRAIRRVSAAVLVVAVRPAP